MSWYVSLGGWLTGAAGMGAIAVLIVVLPQYAGSHPKRDTKVT